MDLAFPPQCPGCGRHWVGGFCDECAPQVHWSGTPMCLKCGRRMPPGVTTNREECTWCRPMKFRFHAARSAVLYKGPMERAVKYFKYKRVRRIAPYFQEIMCRYLDDNPELAEMYRDADAITAVPLHWMRRFSRGFNQSEILAAPVAKLLGLPMENILRRTRNNRPQARLSFEERIENVRGLFAVRSGIALKGKRIILIDDVMTSGSTVSECADVLRRNGAKRVFVYTLCRRSQGE